MTDDVDRDLSVNVALGRLRTRLAKMPEWARVELALYFFDAENQILIEVGGLLAALIAEAENAEIALAGAVEAAHVEAVWDDYREHPHRDGWYWDCDEHGTMFRHYYAESGDETHS